LLRHSGNSISYFYTASRIAQAHKRLLSGFVLLVMAGQ
jgi:hypothetical protein